MQRAKTEDNMLLELFGWQDILVRCNTKAHSSDAESQCKTRRWKAGVEGYISTGTFSISLRCCSRADTSFLVEARGADPIFVHADDCRHLAYTKSLPRLDNESL